MFKLYNFMTKYYLFFTEKHLSEMKSDKNAVHADTSNKPNDTYIQAKAVILPSASIALINVLAVSVVDTV